MVYLARGKPEQALQNVDEAIRDTSSPLFLFHRAEILAAMDRKAEAAAALKEAVKQGFDPKGLHPLERPAHERIAVTR